MFAPILPDLNKVSSVIYTLKKSLPTFNPITDNIKFYISTFENSLANLGFESSVIGKQVIVEFLDKTGLDIYFEALNYDSNIEYIEIKELLINYFSTFKIKQLKETIDIKFGNENTEKLEDYVVRKFNLLKYSLPSIGEIDLINLVIISLGDDELVKQFYQCEILNLDRLKGLAAMYDKMNNQNSGSLTCNLVKYNVSSFLRKKKPANYIEKPASSNIQLNLSSQVLNRANATTAPNAPTVIASSASTQNNLNILDTILPDSS
jgi:hypothetical protein